MKAAVLLLMEYLLNGLVSVFPLTRIDLFVICHRESIMLDKPNLIGQF